MKLRPLAFAAALLLAACTSSPTDTPALDPAAAPSYNGINTFGSGNNTADGPGTVGSGNYVEGGNGLGSGTLEGQNGGGSLGSGNNTQSDTTGRGGNMVGSGN